MSITIEEITGADYEPILALNEASLPHVSRIGSDELAWFHQHASFVRKVTIDGELAAFMIGLRPGTDYKSLNYRWFCERYDDFAYIDRIAVATWAQRRGIAQALYAAFAVAESDAPVMTCEVNLRPANEDSMQFHQTLGFHQVGTQETEGGSKEVALLEKLK